MTTPGRHARLVQQAATASAVSGVSSAGFSTTVQPAASAGPILRVAIAAGKFQGVTSTQTPIGCRWTRIWLAPTGAIASVPSIRTASSAYQRKNSAAYSDLGAGVPQRLAVLREHQPGDRSPRSVISSNARRRHSARCRGGVAAQPGSAR